MIRKTEAALVVALCAMTGLYIMEANKADSHKDQAKVDEFLQMTIVGGVTAQCRDGLYSTAKSKRGQCAGHGGVERWIIRGDE